MEDDDEDSCELVEVYVGDEEDLADEEDDDDIEFEEDDEEQVKEAIITILSAVIVCGFAVLGITLLNKKKKRELTQEQKEERIKRNIERYCARNDKMLELLDKINEIDWSKIKEERKQEGDKFDYLI